jgi:hypothetical protein
MQLIWEDEVAEKPEERELLQNPLKLRAVIHTGYQSMPRAFRVDGISYSPYAKASNNAEIKFSQPANSYHESRHGAGPASRREHDINCMV